MSRPLNEWVTRAACKGKSRLFFEPDRPRARPTNRQAAAASVRTAKARALCESCPVRQECLDAALAEEAHLPSVLYKATIRGGLTAEERDDLVRGDGKRTARCRWCNRRFRHVPHPTGKRPPYCSDECKVEARREQKARSYARRRLSA